MGGGETLLHEVLANTTILHETETHESPYAILFIFGICILGGKFILCFSFLFFLFLHFYK